MALSVEVLTVRILGPLRCDLADVIKHDDLDMARRKPSLDLRDVTRARGSLPPPHIVAAGLKDGETILTAPLPQLRPDMAVTVDKAG